MCALPETSAQEIEFPIEVASYHARKMDEQAAEGAACVKPRRTSGHQSEYAVNHLRQRVPGNTMVMHVKALPTVTPP